MPTFYSQSKGREVRFDEVNECHLINAVNKGSANREQAVAYLKKRANHIWHERTMRIVTAFLLANA